MARRARRRARQLAVAAALVVAALPACGGGSGSPDPEQTLNRYLDAWSRQDDAAMVRLVAGAPADLADTLAGIRTELRISAEQHVAGEVTESDDGTTATVPVRNTFTSDPWGDWTTDGTITLVKRGEGDDERWKVRWSREQYVTGAAPDTRFALDEEWPDRAPILGAGGAPLTVLGPMTRVGVQGSRITDPAPLVDALRLAGASQARIDTALATAKEHPDWFVPVIEITAGRYAEIRDAIYPVPGTVFQQFGTRQTITPGLDAHVVGATGPITAELLAALGSPYGPNDTVGRRGIEAQYERQLAGTPGATIRVVAADGATTVGTLATFPAQPGTAVQTTIDPAVQQAAEAALAGLPGEGAIVAVRASTGEVLAVASVPLSNGFDIALRGQYPPGSTFKIVTTAALLEQGLTPASLLWCPATVTVNGRTFRNFEGEAAGSLSLADAVRLSCNNAFINAVDGMASDVLPATAAKFGLGVDPRIGVAAFGGSVPAPVSADDQAATAIGQAKVTASPLAMAGVAAAVAAGTWHAPRLVAGAPNDTVAPKPLDPGVVAALQDMTARVVANGTAAGAGLPAGTHGKTGTAEFGSGNPPPTHAWFVGYRGDVAFAVLVPNGGVGGRVAAPIAAKFLTALG
jgi:cell division protein FtsI/penicillin-binding protein 2